MAQSSRPCDGCGTEVPRTKPTGPIPWFCSDDCKPRCVVDGCEGPRRKREWCASHYHQQHRTGVAQPFKFKWADPTPCLVCGNPPTYSFREFCSGTCRFLWRKYDGKVPAMSACLSCGCDIDLTEKVGKQGHRRNPLTKFCRRCKQDNRKHGTSVHALAKRDGTNCGICGYPVDMTLRRGDPGGVFCASVDHIIPRAHGGTHDPTNLQLAHFWCNAVKSDRTAEGAA